MRFGGHGGRTSGGRVLRAVAVCLAGGFALTARASLDAAPDRQIERRTEPRSRSSDGPTKGPEAKAALAASWFEANQGQAAREVDFLMRGRRYRAHLTRTEAVLTLEGESRGETRRGPLRLRYRKPDGGSPITGTSLPGRVHYLIGNDADGWVRNVPTHASVGYDGVWKGIDLRYRLERGLLRYDVEVAPGADPRRAVFELDGADSWKLEDERLLVETPVGRVTMTAPVAHQMRDGVRTPVDVSFNRVDERAFGFRVGSFDRTLPLVIDPTLEFATYAGGGGEDKAIDCVLAADGDLLLTGSTRSSDFPVTTGAYDRVFGSPAEAQVLRFDPATGQMVFATFYGGNGDDTGVGIAEDGNGKIHVAGKSSSTDLPTVSALEPTRSGSGVIGFLAVFDADGSGLQYASYLNFAGATTSTADSDGNSYVVMTAGVGASRVTKIEADWSAAAYATDFAASSRHNVNDIACDVDGNVYLGGEAFEPTSFPVTSGSYQTNTGGGRDAFLMKFDSGGSLRFSTLFGGDANDAIHGVALQGTQVVAVGVTESSDLPGVSGSSQATLGGAKDGFVAAVATDGATLEWSTYLGGTGSDYGQAVAAVGSAIAVTGYTVGSGFPTTADAIQDDPASTQDLFLTVYRCDGTRLFSSYLGGDHDDQAASCAYAPDGTVYVVGWTLSDDLATTGAYQTDRDGAFDDFVLAVSGFPLPIAITDPFGPVTEWTRGVAFSQTLATVGGEGALTWDVSAGAAPAGIMLSDAGALTGTPTSDGIETFTVRVTDSCSDTDELEIVLQINPPPAFASDVPVEWTVGRPLDTVVEASGGTGALAHGTVGEPPNGLTLDPDGRLHGTPDTVGKTSFSYEVQDALGATAKRSITFDVRAVPEILDRTFDPCTEGIAFDELLTRIGGIGPYMWSIASGITPTLEGTVDGDGRIAGTLRPATTAQFTARLTDGAGAVAERAFSMLIHPNPSIEAGGIDLAAAGRPFAFTPSGSGGTPPVAWTSSGRPLPLGLALEPVTGVVSGRPTSAGLQDFGLSLVDACSASDAENFTVRVAQFLETSSKKSRVEFVEPADGGPPLRVWFLELLAGTTLDVKLARKGKGDFAYEFELLDRHEQSITLDAFTRIATKKRQLKKVIIPRTDRYFLIVKRTGDVEGTLRLDVRARPASAWSGEVELGPGEETQVTIAAAPGTRPVISAKRGKKSPAVPRIVAVTSDDAAVAGVAKDKAKASKWKADAGVRGGDIVVTLRNDGDAAGTVRWSAKTKAPKGASLQLRDLPSPAVEEDQ